MTGHKQARQIYNALENNNPKQAIKLGLKCLEKHPTNKLVKALLALSLALAKREEQSSALISQVLQDELEDEAVIEAVAETLVQLGRTQECLEVYENAWTRNANPEGIGVSIFKFHLKNLDFDRAHKQSLRLFKKFDRSKYYFWSIMALHSLVQQDKLRNIQHPAVVLVDRMIKKALFEGQVSSFQRLNVCLLIIDKDQKTASELERISPLVQTLEADKTKFQMRVWKSMGKWSNIYALVQNTGSRLVLQDWELVDIYLCAAAALGKEPIFEAKGNSVFEKQNGHVASMEWELRCGNWDGLGTQLIVYYEEFGSKPVCFSTMEPYLSKVDLGNYFSRAANEDRDLQSRICAIKVVEYTTPTRKQYMDMYEQFREQGSVCSDLVILSVLPLLDPACDLSLYRAAELLLYGISHDHDNFYMKLLLILVLRNMGAVSLAIKHYSDLDIKALQLDALAYLICDWIPSLGFSHLLRQMYHDMTLLYAGNRRDTPKMMIEGYFNESYSQIPGFTEFYLRLEHSITKKIVKVEDQLLSILELDSREKIHNYFSHLELGIQLDLVFDNRSVDRLFSFWSSFDTLNRLVAANRPKDLFWLKSQCKLIYALKQIYCPDWSQNLDLKDQKTLISELTEINLQDSVLLKQSFQKVCSRTRIDAAGGLALESVFRAIHYLTIFVVGINKPIATDLRGYLVDAIETNLHLVRALGLAAKDHQPIHPQIWTDLVASVEKDWNQASSLFECKMKTCIEILHSI